MHGVERALLVRRGYGMQRELPVTTQCVLHPVVHIVMLRDEDRDRS